MPNTRPRLLIVDDNQAIRSSLCCVLREIGYLARTAEDGFTALAEMRKEIPGILLSDLNMPGMSGFELLAVVRRNFPNVQTIAMSGSFVGDEVPSGVAADAFYQKGSSIVSLLRIMENLPMQERKRAGKAIDRSPRWVASDGHAASEEMRLTVSCPECLRTFSHALHQPVGLAWQGACAHCHSVIHLAGIQPASSAIEMLARPRITSISPASPPL